jgi:hypothetical protein
LIAKYNCNKQKKPNKNTSVSHFQLLPMKKKILSNGKNNNTSSGKSNSGSKSSKSSNNSSNKSSKSSSKSSNDFWSQVDKKSGVYLITSKEYHHDFPSNLPSDLPSDKGNALSLGPGLPLPKKKVQDRRTLVKIGRANNLRHRLNSYLLYWPMGVHVYSIFFAPKAKVGELERSIHRYLNSKKCYVISDHSHTEEWFTLSHQELRILVRTVLLNAETKYPSTGSYYLTKRGTKINLSGRNIFPFTSHWSVDRLLVSNPPSATNRIKAMEEEVKRLIDETITAVSNKKPSTVGSSGGGGGGGGGNLGKKKEKKESEEEESEEESGGEESEEESEGEEPENSRSPWWNSPRPLLTDKKKQSKIFYRADGNRSAARFAAAPGSQKNGKGKRKRATKKKTAATTAAVATVGNVADSGYETPIKRKVKSKLHF